MTARYHLIELTETVSTNADAMRLARCGETLPLWVRASRQTGGRGRAGRQWTSIAGNLMTTVALRSNAPMAQAGELALVAGIALYDAIPTLPRDLPTRLKWPNDLLIDGKKVGGILVETATEPISEPTSETGGFIAVIGFGLNIAAYPDDAGQPVTSLSGEGIAAAVPEIAHRLAEAFANHLAAWDDGRGFSATTRLEWQARAGQIGERITVSTATEWLSGTYQGLNEQGHLLLLSDELRVRTVTHGDVALAAAAREST